jgi:holin-like protein
MLPSLTLLLVCQLIGTVIQEALGLPVPGPVIGMIILLAGLLVRRRLPDKLNGTAQGLLDHLSLLFVPAGVGVMQQLPLLEREFVPITASLVGSSLITIAVTGLVMQGALRWTGAGVADSAEDRHDS